MRVDFGVAIEYFIDVFFGADFDDIIVLGKHVNNSEVPSIFTELSDAVTVEILPPRLQKLSGVPVGGGICWRNVEEAALGAEEAFGAGSGVEVGFRL